jgi:DNA-binding NtrC family response regulator
VNRGTFRADLYYRLNVVRLLVPPLRDRTGDIEQLARHFHAELSPSQPISRELLDNLKRQSWPGNVRELRAAVERAVLLDDPALLALQAEPPSDSEASTEGFDPAVPFRVAKQRAADHWEQRYVRELMTRAKGNISEASRLARMDRSYLRGLIRKYGLQDEGGDGEG